MVIAISMQKLDTVYAGLADSYYLAALPYLEDAIRPKDLRSLQCFVLIALYSISTPTRTAAYWVVGLATRICQELRIVDEAHITNDDTGRSLNAIEVDLRRRLFWICLSMELGLAHSLGRPSAFAMSHAYIDVQPFLLVDDKYITSSGVLPGSPVSMRKSISMHFMRMRLLQLEIRRTLYLRKRHSPANDSDPWFKQMELKLKKWLAESPRDDEGSGISQMWFVTASPLICVNRLSKSKWLTGSLGSRPSIIPWWSSYFDLALRYLSLRSELLNSVSRPHGSISMSSLSSSRQNLWI